MNFGLTVYVRRGFLSGRLLDLLSFNENSVEQSGHLLFCCQTYICPKLPYYHSGTINAKGNLGITLRRYSKVNAELGEELIRDTVSYLNTHDYQENHPWLVKFGNEKIINEAQKLASQGKHELSLEMYDSLYKQKEQLNLIPTGSGGVSKNTSPVPSPTKGGASPNKNNNNNNNSNRISNTSQAAQDLVLIGTGKFSSMIGKAQAFVKKCRFHEAQGVLKECAAFPKELLGSETVMVVEMQRLQAEICYLTAHFEQATGKWDE